MLAPTAATPFRINAHGYLGLNADQEFGNNTFHEITIGPKWTDKNAFVSEYRIICSKWNITP